MSILLKQITKKKLDSIKSNIVDSSADFIGVADAEGRLIYLNDAAKRMMGYDAEDTPDFRHIADVHANNFEEFALRVIQPAVFAHGSWTGQSFLKHKDGYAVSVMQTVFPVFDDEGKPYGTAAVMKDMSDINQMAETINKNNEMFQEIVDSMPMGVVLIDMEQFNIVLANQWLSVLLGRQKEDVIGQHCYDVLCKRSPDVCPHMMEKDVKTMVGERLITRPDGSQVPVIKTGTWIAIDGKDYLVDTFVDISLQKDLEKGLTEAKIAAEAASLAKSEFLSRMSHEMRTPLNAVIGMLQVAKRTSDLDKVFSCLDIIETSSGHLLGLINDVLDLAKIEAGKLELEDEQFSLSALVAKVNAVIRPKVEEKKIDFTISCDANIPDALIGDSMRLSQVLLNLLSNAVKFTEKNGAVTLSIVGKQLGHSTITMEVSVADNGIGMTEDQMSHLFQSFEQADRSTSRKFGGTGLGLVISQRIVNLFGGEIFVESQPGAGSKFSFGISLPQAKFKVDRAALEKMDIKAFENLFAGKKILIVDDVDLNRMVATELLIETGATLYEAESGRKAFEAFLENQFDLIFMDIQMPAMDGYETVELIRSADKVDAKTVPIIAMSANVFKDDVEKSLESGMNDHVGKPIDQEILLRVSRKYLLDGGASQPSENPLRRVALKKNYRMLLKGQSSIQLSKALANQSGDEAVLAVKLYEFLLGTHYKNAERAAQRMDYEEAYENLKQLNESCRELALGALSAYIENVLMCIQDGNHDFAKLYMHDVDTNYKKACEIIAGILQA